MAQAPVGAWMAAAVLDLLPGQRRAVRALVGVGPVHATANVGAVALHAGSFAARTAAVGRG